MTRRASQICRCRILRALLIACAWLPAVHASAQDFFHTAPDFNGDGAADIVVGVPYEGYYQSSSQGRGVPEAGAVDVLYGAVSGVAVPHPQHWTLASAGLPGLPHEGDHFGFAVAWGLFNGDTYVDLAIGVPGREVDGIADAGAVVIIHGSANGLVASGPLMALAPRYLRQGQDAVPGVPRQGDNFGFSLAAGRWFEGGPVHYLAVGAPGFTAGSAGNQGRGEVVVLYPGYDGGNQEWTQVFSSPEPGDWFGFSLAAGNFGGGGFNYALAIGVPGEDFEGHTDAGAVEVLYVSPQEEAPGRLSFAGAQLLRQSTFVATTQSHSWFGFSLAAGGLTVGDTYEYPDELVIGEPLRTVGFGAGARAGAIHVIEGSHFTGGLDPANTTTVAQGSLMRGGQLPGVSEDGDLFGFAVAVADGILAVGAPGENGNAGSVHILHGVPLGPTAAGAQVLAGDGQFGWSLQAMLVPVKREWGRLLVGAPGRLDHGGVVKTFGLDAAGIFVAKATLTQDSIFNGGEWTEPGDGFGASLGAGGLPWITFSW
jgi:hypothetical protein